MEHYVVVMDWAASVQNKGTWAQEERNTLEQLYHFLQQERLWMPVFRISMAEFILLKSVPTLCNCQREEGVLQPPEEKSACLILDHAGGQKLLFTRQKMNYIGRGASPAAYSLFRR